MFVHGGNVSAKIVNHRIHILLGPLIALLTVFLVSGLSALENKAAFMIGVAIWMAWWWMTEVVPVAVTALLPMILLPVLGISSATKTGAEYMDSILFLYIGGFIMAFAIEKWHLHKRFAFMILSVVGTKPSRILMGVMATTYITSMWISNTATVMMLLAAVIALINEVDAHYNDAHRKRNLAAALLIGLAYAASIGGMATLVGTPTNMVFYRQYISSFPLANDMDFFEWTKIGVPVSLFLLVVAYQTVRWMFFRKSNESVVGADYFKLKLKDLGAWSKEEKRVTAVFVLTILLWFTRSDIDFGSFRFPGWCNLFSGYETYVDDGAVAVFAALLLFLIPSSGTNEKLIAWHDAKKIPLEIILLFGGGFALAHGFEESGLSKAMAGSVAALNVHPILIVLVVVTMVCIISEFASNVASIQLMIPLLISGFAGSEVHPLFILVPATLAASLGFMMPIATPPNTIVYGTKHLHTKELARAGLVVNLAGILGITLFSYLLYTFGYYSR
jgi:solute carrier family 13 (sodium-dependent dicarboxylate transporter), member 2/3/5